MNTHTKSIVHALLFVTLLTMLLAGQAAMPARASGTIRFVMPGGATSASACLTWGTACGLQFALISVANPGDQLWVEDGTYTPNASDRTASFTLRNGVSIYGGFLGTETLLSQRNPSANVTILSGEIGAAGTSDNSYHVVRGGGTNSTAVLDGFTITAGNANTFLPDDSGAGMWNYFSSPTLNRLVFTLNFANEKGAGMYNSGGSSPTLSGVNFISNSAAVGAGAGGGMYNDISSPKLGKVTFSANTATHGGGMYNSGSSPTLTGVTFSGNTTTSGGKGGGIYDYNSSPKLNIVTFISNSTPVGGEGGGIFNTTGGIPVLTNVTFESNFTTIGGTGGGMSNHSSSPALTNVTFSNNSASISGYGGGILNATGSSPTLTNVTFSGNSAGTGGGMYNISGSNPKLTNVTFGGNSAGVAGGMFNTIGSKPVILDSIFWSDGVEISNIPNASSTVVDSVVAGGCPTGAACTNIINSNPFLGSLLNTGGYTKTMTLGTGSSAIDAGGLHSTCATTDQRGITRPQGPRCDIGAVEVTQPTFTAAPVFWNYGLVNVGLKSAGKAFVVTNTGIGNLIIGTVTMGGKYATQFHIASNTCSGATLALGGTCTITAAFAPTTAPGTKAAYIIIPDNAAGHPHTVQLRGAAIIQLALNGGFNAYPTLTSKIPTYWAAASFALTDGKDTINKNEGTASVRIANTSVLTKTLIQTRIVSGPLGSTFLFSLWGKGQAIPVTAGLASAQVLLYSGATLKQTAIITFSTGTYGFVPRTLAFTAANSYDRIVIQLVYSKATGAAWFDGLSLLRTQ
jgi:hypothetical protein